MKNYNNNILMLLILLFTPLSVKPQDASFEMPNEIIQIVPANNNTSLNANYSFVTKNPGQIVASNITSSSGKDFFYFLTEISQLNKTTFPNDITISEKYGDDARNAEISVHSENKLVYSFRALDKKEYLFAAAQESVKRLKKFYINTKSGI